MQTIWLIGFMVLIGAFIGGMTNALAIKMLFRPYNEIKIGSWRLPFTPGLIPKRREEIATQLGRMVVDYLLTTEGFVLKLKDTLFIQNITVFVQKEITKGLQQNYSIATIIAKYINIDELEKNIENKTTSFIEKNMHQWVHAHRTRSFEELLPVETCKKIESHLPSVTTFLLKRGQTFLQSPQGKEQLRLLIEKFLAQRGKIGSIVTMFVSKDKLVDKVQPELVKFLEDQSTHTFLKQLLMEEWNNVKKKTLSDIEKYADIQMWIENMSNSFYNELRIHEYVHKPMDSWLSAYKKDIVEKIVPKGVSILLHIFITYIDEILHRLHIDTMIRDQVQTFSMPRLEALVLSIANRELKMIMYLGALLGGAIGFIQSLLVLFVK